MGEGAPSTLTMRAARKDDLPALVALFREDAFAGPVDRDGGSDLVVYARQFARIAASPDCRLMVAERDGEPVGTFQIVFAPSLPYRAATRAILEAVFVRSDLRGQGIGRAMIAEAEAIARAGGAALITLSSNAGRERAHAFYRRLGFEASHLGFRKGL